MSNFAPKSVQDAEAPRVLDTETMEGVSESWGKTRERIFLGLAAVFLLFHLGVALLGVPAPLERRALHVGVGLILVFVALPTKGRGFARIPGIVLDLAIIVLLAVHCWYFLVFASGLHNRGGLVRDVEVYLGIAVIVILIEATRRTIGWGLVSLVLAALAYGLFGQYISGVWGHGGFSLQRLVGHMYLGYNGLFGDATSASVEFIYLFLILAALLSAMGASAALGDIATSLFGSVRGGPAKVATVGSGLFGMVSGSAAANTASTGGFTIPLMIKSGMHPRVAASVEAVSSVGGQLVPPVMGASAFIMAEFLGVPFSSIVLAAILPALLYYIAVFLMVDFYAARAGIGGVPAEQVKVARRTVWKRLYLLIPLVVVILCVSVIQTTPQRSALIALASCVIVGAISAHVRRDVPGAIKKTLLEGTKTVLPVITAVAASGVIVGMLSLTGLSTKLSSLLISLAGDSLLLLLLLTMVASLILGAGLPTVPTYVLLATLVAPALIDFGVPPLAAHMFIFYFGALADLTPPTAVSVVIASGIAKTNPLRTMVTATRVGAIGYLIPFLFVYHSTIMFVDVPTFEGIAMAILSIVASIVAAVGGLEGWLLRPLGWLSRVLLITAALLAVGTSWLWIGVAWVVISGVVGLAILRGKPPKSAVAAPTP